MKYLDYPQFAELSRALTFTSSECTVFTRIEAYSCKPVAQEKPLYKHIQRIYAPEVAARKYGGSRTRPASTARADSDALHGDPHARDGARGHDDDDVDADADADAGDSSGASSSVPAHLADSPFGNLHASSAARKLLFTVIATLNAAFPDHDFADIPVSTFRREPSPAYVVHSLSSTLQSLRRSAAGNNPDAPAAAAGAATSPPVAGRASLESSMAFFSAAPRTFAGLPASFDASPSAFITGAAPALRNSHGSPSIAATLSPPGQLAQLSLSAGASGSSGAASNVPPAMALPPAITHAQGGTFPAAVAEGAVAQPHDSQRAAHVRSPISPRLNATSPRMAGQALAAAHAQSPPSSASHLPAAITAATHPALASILDDIMCVEECEVYSFHPDIEYDPHASADDDEERLLSVGGARAGGELGLFDDEDEDDERARTRGIAIGPAALSSSLPGMGGGGIGASGGFGAGIGSGGGGGGGGGGSNSSRASFRRRAGAADDLEHIIEQWDEDDDYEMELEVEAEEEEGGAGHDSEMADAGERAQFAHGPGLGHGDESADDALLFDEDVYGQGLSGTQTPRPPAAQSSNASQPGSTSMARPDLTSDTSSSSIFSSGSANFESDGGAPTGSVRRSPAKKRVLGPADRSQEGIWGVPLSSVTSRLSYSGGGSGGNDEDEDDDDDDDDDLPAEIEIYSDSSEPDGGLDGATADEDEDDAAGLLWATYAFFYNKRLKRVLFVNVWARTNAGVEAHAAAAAAAAQARARESTSPRGGGGGFGGFGAAAGGPAAGWGRSGVPSSWPLRGAAGGGSGSGGGWDSGGGGGGGGGGTSISPAHRAISLSGNRTSPKMILLHGGLGSSPGGHTSGGGGGYAAKASRHSAGAGQFGGAGSGFGASVSSKRKTDRTASSRRSAGRKEGSMARKDFH